MIERKTDVTSYIVVLTMILVVLKAFKLISISWVWVFSPLWGWLALIVLVSVVVIVLSLITLALKKQALNKVLKR